jgi:cytochrome c553
MNYRGFAIATILLGLLCFGATLVSCNDGGEDNGTETKIASAPRNGGVSERPADAEQATSPEGEAEAPAPAEAGGDSGSERESSVFVTGEGVYKAANCEMCHGKLLQGTNLAPALKGLSENWEADTLAEYLLDPVGYTENDVRLKANSVQYKLPMPAWKQTGLGEPDLDLLVKWLLEFE